jgi:hypothetical protein
MAKHGQNHKNGNGAKEWAQDLVLEEIDQNNRISTETKKRIMVVVAAVIVIVGTVVVGIVQPGSGENSEPGTGSPTHSPTGPLPIVDQFLSSLPHYSLELATANASSPQAKALAWLRLDPLYNEYENLHRLFQRYTLAVLYHSTNGDSWINQTGWLSNDTECDWYSYSDNDICDEGFRLSTLNLLDNGLDGSLPAELELLTNLQSLSLSDDALSGTIHSELCVLQPPLFCFPGIFLVSSHKLVSTGLSLPT